ncbi:MAG: tetratricopeptide repeat protein, partial [Candidatus Methylomirabilales bacterium]
MNKNRRAIVMVGLVFMLGQGCSSLARSPSPVALPPPTPKPEPSVEAPSPGSARNLTEESAAYYYFMLGSLAEDRGDLGTALRHYEEALAFDPGSVAIRMSIAELYMRRGMVQEAIRLAEAIVANHPENVEGLLLLATAYESIRNARMAERFYREALGLQPDRADVYLRLGNLFARTTKYAEAAEAYRKAITLDPTLYQARYNLARALLEAKQVDEAIVQLEEVLRLRPGLDQASLLLGLTYERLKRWESARTVYRSALEEDPGDRQFLERLAETYLRTGDLAGALAEFQRLAGTYPEDLGLRNRIGLVLIEMRRYEEAQKALEEVLTLDRDNQEARFYLAISLEGQQRYEQALAELTKIPSRGEQYGDVLIHKGFVFGHLDRVDEALAAFQEAARLKPQDGNTHYLVGVTHLRRKEYAQ